MSERFEAISEKRRFQVSAAISKEYTVDSQKYFLQVSTTLHNGFWADSQHGFQNSPSRLQKFITDSQKSCPEVSRTKKRV